MILMIEGFVIGFFIALPLGMWIGGRNVNKVWKETMNSQLKK